jgi:hypothetical protein
MHGNVVEHGLGRAAGPTTAQQVDLVTTSGQSAKDLVQVELGPPGLRVLAVLPVHHEEAQSDAPESARDRVQHAVHEARAFRRAVAFGETHGLLQ